MSNNFFKVKKGQNLQPMTGSTVTAEGDIAQNTTTKQLETHNGTSVESITTDTNTQTISNKTIPAASNSITSTTNKAAQFNTGTGKLEASAVTNTELGYVSGVTSPIQAQLNAISGAAIDSLTGDVTATGPGAAAATVVSVGTSSAAAVHTAELAANAATAANTASAILKRDGAGQVAATTFTGALAGNASTATLAGNVTGIVAKANGGTGADNSAVTFPSAGTLATLAGTETLTNKTIGDALTYTQIATPATPSATHRTLYPKSDGKFYHMGSDGIETPVGSGAGGSLNFLTLGSAYSVDNSTDSDFETTIGRWTVYANTPGISPVDMTGGSPVSTLVRSATSPLDGSASAFFDLGSGASRQGEGVVLGPVYVPPGYRGRTVQLSMVWAATGALVENDLIPYAYDITNSALIQPFQASKILGAQGKMVATISIPTTCAQLRVGIHCARTATTALALKFDDVKLSDEATPMGLAGGNVRSDLILTPSTGFGSYTNLDSRTVRTGDRLSGNIFFITGSVVNAVDNAYILLPAGLRIDASKYPTGNHTKVGDGHYLSGGSIGINANAYTEILFYDGVNTDRLYFAYAVGATTGTYTKLNAGIYYSPGVGFQYSFRDIAIAGYDANVTMAESSQFKISSFLANGTRVTGTPSKLGEYRALIKNASAYTYSDDAPSTAPNASDGMRFYARNYSTAGSVGQTNKFVLFVGKNKNVKLEVYSSAGRAGAVDPTVMLAGSSVQYGTTFNYDTTTGLVVVDAGDNQNSGVGYRAIGRTVTSDTTAAVDPIDGYFDITVSENALAVGVQAPRSEIRASGTTTNGSIGVRVRVFTTATTTGTAVQYISDSVNGDSFKTLEDGNYSVSFSGAPNSLDIMGISLNANSTISITALPVSQVLAMGHAYAAGAFVNTSWSGFLPAGSIIKAHQDGTTVGLSFTNLNQLTITKVSN